MPETNGNHAAYATSYQDERAKMAKEKVPLEFQTILHNVMDSLSQDPDAQKSRLKELDTKGQYYSYIQNNPNIQIWFKLDRDKRRIIWIHFAAPVSDLPTKSVFVSYSHKDRKFLEELTPFLIVFKANDLLHIWDDREIKPGAEWREAIWKALEDSEIAVLVLTQNFLSSKFIREEELPKMLFRQHIRAIALLGIYASTCTLEISELEKLQLANDPGHPLDKLRRPKRKEVLTEISRVIMKTAKGQ